MFTELQPDFARTDPGSGRRRGLKTAIATVRRWRRDQRVEKARRLRCDSSEGPTSASGVCDQSPEPGAELPSIVQLVGGPTGAAGGATNYPRRCRSAVHNDHGPLICR
jgi:hypothetical protein